MCLIFFMIIRLQFLLFRFIGVTERNRKEGGKWGEKVMKEEEEGKV